MRALGSEGTHQQNEEDHKRGTDNPTYVGKEIG